MTDKIRNFCVTGAPFCFSKPRSITIFMMRQICTASTGGDAMAPVKTENLILGM